MAKIRPEVSKMRFKNGDQVEVRTFGGGVIIGYVLGIEGETAIITTPAERERAKKEGRKAISIGFPLADIRASKKGVPGTHSENLHFIQRRRRLNE